MSDKEVVKLSVAYRVEKDSYEYVSIHDHLDDNEKYFCPFCKNEVSFKKGNKRLHHFFHLSKIDCKPTGESLLHEEAKMNLCRALRRKEPINIIVDNVEFIKDEQTKKLLSLIDSSGIVISIKDFDAFNYSEHKPECSVGDIRPDIVSKNTYSDEIFAWEIFVTHEVEKEKSDYFKNNNLHYIELEVLRLNKKIIYKLKSYYGFNLFKPKKKLFESLFEFYKQDLLNYYVDELKQDLLKAMALDERNKVFDCLLRNNKYLYDCLNSNEIYEFISDYELFAKLKDSCRKDFIIEGHKNYAYYNINLNNDWIDVIPSKINYSRNSAGDYLLINGYNLESPLIMLDSFIKSFRANNYFVYASFNKDGYLSGFKISSYGGTKEYIIEKESNNNSYFEIFGVNYGKSFDGKYYARFEFNSNRYIDGSIPKSTTSKQVFWLYMLIKYFVTKTKIKILLGEGERGKRIFAIKLMNMFSDYDYCSILSDFCIEYIRTKLNSLLEQL